MDDDPSLPKWPRYLAERSRRSVLPVSEGAVRKRCDVTIKGEPGEMLLGAFSDVRVRQAPGVIVLAADLDRAALHGLLARDADLGLELMGVSLQAESGQPRGSDRP